MPTEKRLRNKPKTESLARALRKTQTRAEQKMWAALRNGQLNDLKFRRQYPIGNYIVDFYNPSHKLVIEIDGDVHDGQEEYDATRTKGLESIGYHVIRFTNREIYNQMDGVIQTLLEIIQTLPQFPSIPGRD